MANKRRVAPSQSTPKADTIPPEAEAQIRGTADRLVRIYAARKTHPIEWARVWILLDAGGNGDVVRGWESPTASDLEAARLENMWSLPARREVQ